MADIVLINPKFQISFWGLEHALPFLGKRAAMPVAALPLIAALTPAQHRVTIIDENVEPIDFERCARADIVGITGMVVQRRRMREILTELKRRGAFTIVGGPWVSVREDYFGALADVIFIGEADESWPRFLAAWQAGKPAPRYAQAEATDMQRVPPPRLDLLKLDKYAFGSVQFSRGCPFLCEFCDIIVIFGRKPRLKTPHQIIAELEALRARKISLVFIVDDNLIGNKKAMKEVLRHVAGWQQANGFPLDFFTEATLDLADDPELMRLMTEANISAVFVGIESPNEAALREARKLQNVRGGEGAMVEKVRRIQEAGMEVWAGMILGFDSDDAGVFAAQARFLAAARINTAMVGMLSAIPKTPLYARLLAAGRLDTDDEPACGTNVLPLAMSREALSEGFVRLMRELYAPQAYFERLDDLYVTGRLEIDRAWRGYAARHPWRRRGRHLRLWTETLVIAARLACVPERPLRRVYRRRLWRMLSARRNPALSRVYAIKCAVHYHMHRLVQALGGADRAFLNTY